MGKAPFLVLGLPRSRTAWIARFLSYGEWSCGHDQLRYMRSLDDVKAWLSLENSGTCETGAAAYWRLALKFRPDIRVVTIRRPVDDVLESLARVGLDYGMVERRKVLAAMDRKLEQIEGRIPNVLSIAYQDLQGETACSQLFRFCLPYNHDPAWWNAVAPINIQINFPALMRYIHANGPAIEKLIAQARQTMLTDMAIRPAETGGLTIQEETIDAWHDDCQHLFREHCVAVGEHPDNWKNKNIPLMRQLYGLGVMQVMIGRCNGKAFGYLMTIVAPSLEGKNRTSAQHTTFYASPAFPGLGLKLQRAALTALQGKGVQETFMRAGVRGDGDRTDVLFRRLGAQDFGRMFRVELGN